MEFENTKTIRKKTIKETKVCTCEKQLFRVPDQADSRLY
jgi:hypothetical protein